MARYDAVWGGRQPPHLLWYQWGASAFLLVTGMAWPSPGTTVDWAYAILALCLGGGAFVFKRNGIPQ